MGRQRALGSRSLGSDWRGEVGEYRTGFLLGCDAMVMPRRMGEGGREKKEPGKGEQGVKSRGARGGEDEGPGPSDATGQSELKGHACPLPGSGLVRVKSGHWFEGPWTVSAFGRGSRADAPLPAQRCIYEHLTDGCRLPRG